MANVYALAPGETSDAGVGDQEIQGAPTSSNSPSTAFFVSR